MRLFPDHQENSWTFYLTSWISLTFPDFPGQWELGLLKLSIVPPVTQQQNNIVKVSKKTDRLR